MERIGAMLLVRGLVSLAFASYLGAAATPSWLAYFDRFAGYLATDGILGAILGLLLLRESIARQRQREMALGIAILVDAGGRLCSGAALLIWPGIAGFPLTVVVFIAVMALGTASVGLIEAWLTAREQLARHGAEHQAPQFMAGPVALASLVSIAFGAATIIWIGSIDTVLKLFTGFVTAAGTVSLAMAWSRWRMEPRRT